MLLSSQDVSTALRSSQVSSHHSSSEGPLATSLNPAGSIIMVSVQCLKWKDSYHSQAEAWVQIQNKPVITGVQIASWSLCHGGNKIFCTVALLHLKLLLHPALEKSWLDWYLEHNTRCTHTAWEIQTYYPVVCFLSSLQSLHTSTQFKCIIWAKTWWNWQWDLPSGHQKQDLPFGSDRLLQSSVYQPVQPQTWACFAAALRL